MEYTKTSAEELREALKVLGMNDEEVKDIKGKGNLVRKHQEMTGIAVTPNEEVALLDNDGPITLLFTPPETPAVESCTAKQTSEPMPLRPDYTSPEWEDFVLSQLTDKEKDKEGHPRVNGLRRLAEKLLGEILTSGPIETKSYEVDSSPSGKAVVTFSIVFLWAKDGLTFDSNAEPDTREYRAVASCTRLNTDDKFCVFPEAIAETRAEARALRRALRISTVSADEIPNQDTARVLQEATTYKSHSDGPSDMITDQQKLVITKLCERNKIDLMGFINNGKGQYSSMDEIKRETAVAMIAALNNYQTVTPTSVPVPEKLRVENEG